ncbi:cell division cycle protein 123 homolog [Topomyia yanbarensis]|uniref:cell division cycle protein 123 homolog n=1 Tax=Topomyia yanbarensis TaxID=2498891 RepID=UPI00273B0A88|nr:cell division cycle protein 123 homolog [Topomyia yanbarensis]
MLLRNIELEKTACMLVNWYEQFEKNTIKAQIIPIPVDVLKYLRQDMVILPKECANLPSPEIARTKHFNSYNDQFSDDEEDGDALPEFPVFSGKITEAIEKLGGSAFLKSDWHCPKDAQWITLGQTLCVKDITDVYQLLKASSFCKEDFAERPPSMSGYHVVLKKWRDIHPGSEFRCFVKNKSLMAISPRHWPSYHEHIAAERSDIVCDIVSLFKEKIKHRFPLNDYVFDVYRPAKDHVVIMDFSPYGKGHSESLAFDYDQLDADALAATIEEEDDPEFRYLPEDCGIQPNRRNNYGFPQDVIDMFQTANGASTSSTGSGEEENDLIHRLIDEWHLQTKDDGSNDDE